MSSDGCDTSAGPTAGRECDYINQVPVIVEDEAIQPGSMKVKNWCIKPIMLTQ